MQVCLQLKTCVTRKFGLRNNLLMSFCRKLYQPQHEYFQYSIIYSLNRDVLNFKHYDSRC